MPAIWPQWVHTNNIHKTVYWILYAYWIICLMFIPNRGHELIVTMIHTECCTLLVNKCVIYLCTDGCLETITLLNSFKWNLFNSCIHGCYLYMVFVYLCVGRWYHNNCWWRWHVPFGQSCWAISVGRCFFFSYHLSFNIHYSCGNFGSYSLFL